MKQPFWAPALAKVWRLLALACAAWLLHSAPHRPAPLLSLEDARAFFPTAAQLYPRADGAIAAQDEAGQNLGLLVTTSPESDGIIGYAGPSNLLVALDADGAIAGIRVLESADTQAHVEELNQGSTFAQSLLGWRPALETPPKPQGTAGSTLTALAFVEGIAKRFGARAVSLRFPDPLTLDEARLLFPDATGLASDEPQPGWHGVRGSDGTFRGYVVRTSPASDSVTGYAGPTECLVAVAPDRQTLLQVRLRKSYDTEEYVERVVEDREYLKSLTRWKASKWPGLEFETEKIEGVAGATLTSFAVAEGIRQRFRQDAGTQPGEAGWRWPGVRDTALWFFYAGAALMAFSGWRGSRRVRLGWQLLLVGGLGLWLGQFVTLALLAGWARNGVPWKQAAPLVVLAGAALLVPWGTRRQLYCHQVCPHGAAQEILGRLAGRTWQLPERLHRALRLVPGLLLAAALCVTLWGGFSPGQFEPFDFWVLGWASAIPAVLAVGGLAASFFVPMAYCRYGCPAGALFGFMRTSSSQEAFTRRDAAALCVLLLGAFLVYRPAPGLPSAGTSEVRGTGFGTTWCVKTRGAARPLGALRGRLAAEVERIETGLSHWRPESATSRFNRSTSTTPQSVPNELVRLVEVSQRVSRASGGAYDTTVAPLVSAWGYGPQGAVAEPPSEETLRTLLHTVGWEKVEVGTEGASLRKAHPSLSLDLGSVLQGYAVDQLASILDEAGFENYLIEVGGELRARGAWNVAIENPADASRPLARVELCDAALATSGLARARRRVSGEPVSHIISPKSGRPVESGVELVSVRAPSCLEADAWATGLIASGLEGAREIAQREGLTVWLLDSTGGFSAPNTQGGKEVSLNGEAK